MHTLQSVKVYYMRRENRFHLVLIRSADGIRFNENHLAVHAVFILIGYKNMFNLHLCALAAIAQMVEHPSFGKRWMDGKDLLLLSKDLPQ